MEKRLRIMYEGDAESGVKGYQDWFGAHCPRTSTGSLDGLEALTVRDFKEDPDLLSGLYTALFSTPLIGPKVAAARALPALTME